MIDTSKNCENKKVKVVKQTSGHGAQIGSFATIKSAVNANNIRLKEFPSWVFYSQDLEFINETREEIQKRISKFQEDIKAEEEKLKFMSENNLDIFDETQYKVFKTLSTLDNKDISQIEKTKLITSLITG